MIFEAREAGHRFTVHSSAPGGREISTPVLGVLRSSDEYTELSFSIGEGMQFWVTRDNLLFVRLVSRGRQGRSDVRFNKYEKSGGGWVAAEVEQLVNGSRRLHEEYYNIRTGVPLSEAMFDPTQWSTAPHWHKP